MSYHTIKRVLGESSLARKLRWLFGMSLLVLITGSFWMTSRSVEELVYDKNKLVGRQFVGIRLMNDHVHFWSENSDPTHKGSLDYLTDQLPATSREDVQTHVILPQGPEINPRKISPPADEREWEMHNRWLAEGAQQTDDGKEGAKWRYDENNRDDVYLYYQPIFASTDQCASCHRTLGKVPNPTLNNGDLMAIVRVSIPMKATTDSVNENRARLVAIAIITVFLSMVALYFIVRYVLMKPLTHLREVSDEIARGDLTQRADIHTGDEFEELGAAFNRMLRHMTEAQEELQSANASLDGKVDQLAQANMRLYQMNRLKSDFLATVSHELRTPLNSILGFSDVLESIESLDDKQKRYVENIQRSGRMLLEMINDILDLAKIESGKMNVKPSEFQIRTVIAAQCDMARPLTEKRNIDLTPDVEPNLPPIYQDQPKVQQILSNLLSNAIKFTPEGGRITVSARRNSNEQLVLVVADTGVGISEEDQTVIFEKFRQGSTVLADGNAMTREYSGTGLGLSIVKELCKLLDGEISLESEFGIGSTFTVTLPWRKTERTVLETELNEQLEQMTNPIAFDSSGNLPAPPIDGKSDASTEEPRAEIR